MNIDPDYPRTPHEILADLRIQLDADPSVQWDREHDKLYALREEIRILFGEK